MVSSLDIKAAAAFGVRQSSPLFVLKSKAARTRRTPKAPSICFMREPLLFEEIVMPNKFASPRKARFHHVILTITLLALIVPFSGTLATQQASQSGETKFEAFEEMIPMRDGVKLYTVICVPKNSDGATADLAATHPLRRRSRNRREAALAFSRSWSRMVTSSPFRTFAGNTSPKASSE